MNENNKALIRLEVLKGYCQNKAEEYRKLILSLSPVIQEEGFESNTRLLLERYEGILSEFESLTEMISGMVEDCQRDKENEK